MAARRNHLRFTAAHGRRYYRPSASPGSQVRNSEAVSLFHKTKHGQIVMGDSLAYMASFGPASVDLIITSPPFGTRTIATSDRHRRGAAAQATDPSNQRRKMWAICRKMHEVMTRAL